MNYTNITKRFEHVTTDQKQNDEMAELRKYCISLANKIGSNCPEGRGKALALTKVEECLYWANKAICGND